jgi:hypothetical protein
VAVSDGQGATLMTRLDLFLGSSVFDVIMKVLFFIVIYLE